MHERRALAIAAKRERRKLGARLRELRLARHMTQARAAEAVGVHPVHVARMESGAANPTITTLVAFALAYGVPLRALFDEATPEK
jgi:transcriptional regulator with XRE-family HTH domain